jgi:phospholipid/cholesterol/gamma-HCH transport system substrate-binding protein
MRARFAAGALIAAAVAVLLVVLLSGGGERRAIAVFDSVDGLVSGAKVTVAGVQVGQVEKIALGADGYPHVTLALPSDFRLRRGATADLRRASLSGEFNRYVALSPGDGPTLRDGALLGLARTDQPVEVDDVLSTLDAKTRRSVHGLLASVDAGTKGRGADLARVLRAAAPTLAEATAAVREVNDQGTAVADVLRQLHSVSGALAADPGATANATRSIAALLTTTASRERSLARTVAALPAAVAAPSAALARLDRAMPALRAVATSAQPAARALRPLAAALLPALGAAQPTVAAARSLAAAAPAQLTALEPLVRTARGVVPTLDSTLRQLDPMLDNARVRLPDFFSFFSNWADFTSNYDALGHAARVAIVLPPAPLNTIGPSESRSGALKPPFERTPGVLEGQPWMDFQSSFVGSGG